MSCYWPVPQLVLPTVKGITVFAGNTWNNIFGPRISVYFSLVTHALVFIPNQREIKADLSSTEVQAKSCHKYACQFIWRQFPVNRKRYSTFQPQYNQSCGLGLSNCKALGGHGGACRRSPAAAPAVCSPGSSQSPGSSSPPSWLPIFKHALPGARRADPKPRGRQPRRAGERRPSEHLPPPSGHALGSGSGSAGLGRRSTRSVEAEAGGSLGTVSAALPTEAAGIRVRDPKKPYAREALARRTEKDLAARRQSSWSPPPPQSGGLCSPALDTP